MREASSMALGLLLLGLSGCAQEYSAAATEGWVVDAQSKAPLPGTHVVAHWELRGGGGLESQAIGTLELRETVTDAAGHFSFPAWGPKKAPEGHLGIDSPQLTFFKPGYVPMGLVNEYRGESPSATTRASQWSGKTIPLRRLSGIPAEDAQAFSAVYTDLEFSIANCLWQKIPRMALALDRETKRLNAAGIQRSFYSIDRLQGTSTTCPNAVEFLKGVPE